MSAASITSVLITGANAGVGKECARQMALRPEVTRVVLGCRNKEKAEVAKAELEEATDKAATFEILIVDVSDLDSVRNAVQALAEPVDALVMNAGGYAGKTPEKLASTGVIAMVQVNVLGHVALLDGLIAAKKVTKAAIYAGSETSRGVMNWTAITVKTGSVEEFVSMCDGKYYGEENINNSDMLYAGSKYIATLWMSSVARKHTDMRIITVSPGLTTGTEVTNDLPAFKKILMGWIFFPAMNLLGKSHPVETGAKRYVDVLTDEDTYKTGIFYASKGPGATGPMGDQAEFSDDYKNETYQDNANEALHSFIKD